MIKLRIAIPTLNAGKTLSSTLDSLEGFGGFAEIVIIDSGSTDETLSIADRYGVPVRFHPAGNMYAAINEGLKDAEADWLTYINGDDILYASNVIERIQAAKHDEDVLYGAVDFIDDEGRFLHAWKSARPHHLLSLYEAGFSPMLQQGTLFRNRVFRQNQGFSVDYKYVSDADFWFRALQAGVKFSRAENPTVAGFRLHEGQFSQRMETAMKQEHAQMWKCRIREAKCSSSAMKELWIFRFDNRYNYIERMIRRDALEGRVSMAKSYDLFAR
jgi:glycosyltransferase involved in cell wall biosynthesis